MRPADTWVDYELIDATNHNRRAQALGVGVDGKEQRVIAQHLLSQRDEVVDVVLELPDLAARAAAMEYIVKTTLCPVKGGHTNCDEIGLPVSATGGVVPCGATAIWEK